LATSQLSGLSGAKALTGAGKFAGLAAFAPLLGASLGGLLGGGSKTGQILGSLGGLLGGGIATGVLSSSTPLLGGAIGALTGALGVVGAAAVFAAPLLVGAYLLKRNAARRRDEKSRDALMVDTLKNLGEIKSELEGSINGKRTGVNIDALLDETKNISANYFTEANKLKDKKTRGIAIKDGNERVGIVPPNGAFPSALTNQIYNLADSARQKEEIRAIAAQRDRQVLPEFAQGGLVKAKNGGHLAVVGEGGFDEFILSTDPKYKKRSLGLLGAFIEKINFTLPKFATGGVSSGGSFSMPSITPTTNATPNFVFNGNIVLEGFTASEDAQAYLETPDGQRQVINIVEDAAKNDKLRLQRRK
jgi:hypothetical protein